MDYSRWSLLKICSDLGIGQPGSCFNRCAGGILYGSLVCRGVEFVQQSLREAIAKVLAIATSSSKLDKIAAGTSPELSIATNP
jgi:hypothetical protein